MLVLTFLDNVLSIGLNLIPFLSWEITSSIWGEPDTPFGGVSLPDPPLLLLELLPPVLLKVPIAFLRELFSEVEEPFVIPEESDGGRGGGGGPPMTGMGGGRGGGGGGGVPKRLRSGEP